MGKRKSRMFNLVDITWNPVIGCKHICHYCWARRLAETRLKRTRKYRDGFKPKLYEEELKAKFRPNEFVFVSDMGDLLGSWVPKDWILKVLKHIAKFPRTTFLLLTKNPARYLEFKDVLGQMDNIILGATIETDNSPMYKVYRISRAPPPDERIKAMISLRHSGFANLMVSIEPILDFTPNFPQAITRIDPLFVYVGYDNYNHKLPEPPLHKTRSLIKSLKAKGIQVYEKTIRKAWYER